MANYSNATGTYRLDFTNCKVNGEAMNAWFLKLRDKLESLHYSTRFEPAKVFGLVLYVPFSGIGRWAYSNNLEWFIEDDELSPILSEMDGLKMTVEYQDEEFGIGFIGKGVFEITVIDGVPTQTGDEWEEDTVYPQSLLKFGYGEEYVRDCLNLTGDELEQVRNMGSEEWEMWQDAHPDRDE
ncbi:hypothetical protein V9W64_10650 [Neisseria leonii]|uniref:Uncharacterized protein n=1 Tax=Neisseria leonii TaxID=2995413 RepID=A0A9X4E4Y6_9NEIS|nr:hypothetical protein [Neisseria sp. 51.81]MDD9328789.1 hypothetical protein [Neisseria sp. 51.81]